MHFMAFVASNVASWQAACQQHLHAVKRGWYNLVHQQLAGAICCRQDTHDKIGVDYHDTSLNAFVDRNGCVELLDI